MDTRNRFLIVLLVAGLSLAKIIDDASELPAGGASLNSGKGLIMIAIVIFCALFAGIGATSLILPILIVFYKFSPHLANSHAAAFTFVAICARLIYDSRRSTQSFPNINFHVILCSAPAASLGVLIGTLLNQITPSFVLFLIINIVLLGLLVITLWKLWKYYKAKEGGQEESEGQELTRDRDIKKEKVEDEEEVEDLIINLRSHQHRDEGDAQERKLEYGTDDRPIRPVPVAIPTTPQSQKLQTKQLVLMLLVFLLNPLYLWLRGTSYIDTLAGVNLCKLSDMWLQIIFIVLYVVLIFLCLASVVRSSKQDLDEEHQERASESHLNVSECRLLALVFLFVGILCGYFTAGTLTVVTLGFAVSKLDRSTANQTALLLVMWISLCSFVCYSMKGEIFFLFTLVSCIVIFVALLAARFFVYDNAAQTHKLHLFLAILAVLTLAAIPLNIYTLWSKYQVQAKMGILFKFMSLCMNINPL